MKAAGTWRQRWCACCDWEPTRSREKADVAAEIQEQLAGDLHPAELRLIDRDAEERA